MKRVVAIIMLLMVLMVTLSPTSAFASKTPVPAVNNPENSNIPLWYWWLPFWALIPLYPEAVQDPFAGYWTV